MVKMNTETNNGVYEREIKDGLIIKNYPNKNVLK